MLLACSGLDFVKLLGNLSLYFSSNVRQFQPLFPGVSHLAQPPACLPGDSMLPLKLRVRPPLPCTPGKSPPSFSASPVRRSSPIPPPA